MSGPPGELVHLRRVGPTATITLDSPANRNALSAQVRAELVAHLAAANADPGVRAVVLSHTGRVFCSGLDLTETRGSDSSSQGVHGYPAVLEAVWTSPTPVVARVAGAARAGGVGLLAACDIAVAATGATFAFPEVRLGVVPAVIAVTVLPRMLPRAVHELFLTGEAFDAARAVATGLLTRAVPEDELDDEVARYAGMLARAAPGAVAATKRLLLEPTGPLGGRLAAAAELSARHFASAEGQEGVAAFRGRRAPSWVDPG